MSVFLEVPESRWVASNALAFAIPDAFPVSPGHTLVVTRRVIADWFSATHDERLAVLDLVEEVKRILDDQLHPDGYNVGFNAGEAAGQTVPHLHVHVIPRFRGDMDDPRGGVRHVIPNRGNYLRAAAAIDPLATGGIDNPFARHILPLFERADDIAIVAAFVQESGLERIREATLAALSRGARIRILTGDYLEITQASALELLLDWQQATAADSDEDGDTPGRLEAAVIEVDRLPPRVRAFHPKSWRFESASFGIAFVGSSNLSRSALDTGIEWNLRVDRDRDPIAYARVRDAFESLWAAARRLDAGWVERYAERARRTALPAPAAEIDAEPLSAPPAPHEVQKSALEALRACRAEGRRRAVVVLATGLGKTWLAAFDLAQLRDELGRRPRLLFVAHRRELLRQAARTYRRLLHSLGEQARVGWFAGDDSSLDADLVFASISKLSRPEHLARLRTQQFDYVVVDEVHHAAAASYRRLLDCIDPMFLLGLTATPDRADSADVLGLFDDFVAYQADIPRGIGLGRLVPFHYFGVKDDIDYDNIPWRNRRFDPEVLAAAAQTEARMQTLWRAWSEHPGTRSLVFCCSIAHAQFVRSWLRERGIRVAAVFAGESSDDRDTAIERLGRGELDAVCAVDVLNEGVDVPSVDRIVMLRPTESSTIFLQQLGRGLRAADGKHAVTVVDFVGNHRVFLERLRALLSLGQAAGSVRTFLASAEPQALPEGCSVEVELEAKRLLSRLFSVRGADEVERAYRELRIERGADDDPALRPRAGELQRLGYELRPLRDRHGSWFEFVRGEGDLLPDEAAVLGIASAFLRELEVTPMDRCFKMVTLEALLEADRLVAGMPVDEISLRCHALLRRSPELFKDVSDETLRVPALDDITGRRWIAYWRRNPIAAWTGASIASSRPERRTWFRLDGDRFLLDLGMPPELESALAGMTRELVDYRLAKYRDRTRERTAAIEGFVCKVLSNQRDPILKLPPRTGAAIPEGETDVRLPDGAVWQFRFAKEYCNVARPAGTPRNQLPDLLRGWFGPRAGQPGTAFQVRFHAGPDGLWVEPVQAQVIELASRRRIAAYPDLRAAAGHPQAEAEVPDTETVSLPVDGSSPDLFAVRVAGTSMDGGKEPLRDGDWVVLRVARGQSGGALENRVVLVEVHEDGTGSQFLLKRLRRHGAGWTLTSDNPDGPTFAATEAMTPIARLEHAIRPEDLAPPTGTTIPDPELPTVFGIDELSAHSGRHGGHLFVFIDQPGILVEPDRIRFAAVTPRPSETAYVLARHGDHGWRYLGVARQTGERGTWALPDVDHATWRAFGAGRDVSRRLPEGALARAQLVVDALLARLDADRWLERQDGNRARILGPAPRGGIRVDGGPTGFQERTVSVVDLAWVVVAADDVAANGGLLDEARVNRVRYLEGTPKGSTRWIDTGWAIAAWHATRDELRTPVVGPNTLLRVHLDDGTPLDASFRVERVGDASTIVYESRGGTRGSAAERNVDYAQGLELLLARLARAGLRIDDILVESRDTASLPEPDRRLALTFPLDIDDPAALRKKISAAQARVGRRPGARGGGNQTKRLRIFVTGTSLGARSLAALLERSPTSETSSTPLTSDD